MALLFAVASTSGVSTPTTHFPHPVLARTSRIQSSLFFGDNDPAKAQLLRMSHKVYGQYPDRDAVKIANRAASSLSEEENGTWSDVATCTLRNVAVVGALLAAVGALPGQASAAVSLLAGDTALPSLSSSTTQLVAVDAETLDVIASFTIPWIVGGALVAFAAANYEKLIDTLNDDRRR